MVLGTSAEKVTGYISFPCCKKQKKILYGYPTGQVSDMCPRCKKKAMFDWCGIKKVDILFSRIS